MRLRPIGRLRTPFATVADCPRNGRALRPPPLCAAELDAAYAPGLDGIDGFSHLVLLYWLGPQPDRLTVTPRFDGRERGVFSCRSPVRPNPIGLSVVSLHGVERRDGEGPVLRVRNLDCMDGTPLLDVKPYLSTTDSEPDASMGFLS